MAPAKDADGGPQASMFAVTIWSRVTDSSAESTVSRGCRAGSDERLDLVAQAGDLEAGVVLAGGRLDEGRRRARSTGAPVALSAGSVGSVGASRAKSHDCAVCVDCIEEPPRRPYRRTPGGS